jgi:hypothetical protein
MTPRSDRHLCLGCGEALRPVANWGCRARPTPAAAPRSSRIGMPRLPIWTLCKR